MKKSLETGPTPRSSPVKAKVFAVLRVISAMFLKAGKKCWQTERFNKTVSKFGGWESLRNTVDGSEILPNS